MKSIKIFSLFILLSCQITKSQVDLLIFSFDRPLQLYALLESLEKYVSDLGEIAVLYRTSTNDYDAGYNIIKSSFPNIIYIHQSRHNPHADFKEKTVDIINKFKNSYLMFAVDDIIVKDYINVSLCTKLLEQTGAYGFYLRLGKNINYCYMANRAQPVPPLHEIEPGIFTWRFGDGVLDWRYPNNVDMAIYRREYASMIRHLSFHNPNSLEGQWGMYSNMGLKGLCFAQSKIVNIPLNSVNNYPNKNMNFATTKELLTLFNEGLKIDITPLFMINNNSPHLDYKPSFVIRQ